MILTNDFVVQAAIGDAWPVLNDIPRVARCLPGAELESSDGDLHRGRMSAKIGPISATYAGTATVLESDDDTHTVVLQLDAREARGQGMASAQLTVRMTPNSGGGTHVTVETALKMTGAHAQFGRGILQSVAGKMIATFAANLEAEIAGGDTGGAAAAGPGEPGTRRGGEAVPAAAPAALDVASLLPIPSLPGAARIVAPLLLGAAVGALWGRGRRHTSPISVHFHFAQPANPS